MINFIKSKLFWAIFVVVAMMVLVIGLNSNKNFVGETDLLVLPKGDRTARNIEQVIGNVKEIPGSLKFFDIMLSKNVDIEDPAAGMADAKRKEIWSSLLKVEQKGQSGVIAVKFTSPVELQAQIVSQQTAQDVITVMSRYYDVKTDLEIRLIDGPIVKQNVQGFGIGLLAIALALGLLLGIIGELLFEKIAGSELSLPRPNIHFPTFGANQAQDVAPEAKEILEAVAPKKEASGGARKAAAPENLPVGSEFVLNAVRRTEKEMKKAEEVAVEPKTHEATEDEIRARLNKLLGGKM